MSVRKICRNISRTGSSPGDKTLQKIEFKRKQQKNMQILGPSEELKLEAITFIVTYQTCLTKHSLFPKFHSHLK